MQTIKLNLIPGGVMPVVNVSQYDVGRMFSIQVYEGASSYSLTGKSVEIRGTKPDGNGFAYGSSDGVIAVSGSTVTVTTVQQMTAVGGDTTVELRITASGIVLGTLNFILAVENSALSDDTPISETDIPAIERDMQAAVDAAEDAAADAQAAASHYPYINADNKHWMVWDVENETWTDTGIVAEGNSGDYSQLLNKPQINSHTLSGNQSAADLGLATDAVMTGATSGAAGAKGLVPAPAAGDQNKFLRGDGSWEEAGGGSGVPAGGTTNQVLAKNSNTDGDTKWMDVPSVAEVNAIRDNGAVNFNAYPYTDTTKSVGGLTYTDNGDGTVTVGTATSSSATEFWFHKNTTGQYLYLKNGTYKFTGCPAGGAISTGYHLILAYKDPSNTEVSIDEIGNGATFTINGGYGDPNGASVYCRILIRSGTVVSSPLVFKPMISPAAMNLSYSDYQPYAMTNRELTEEVIDLSQRGGFDGFSGAGFHNSLYRGKPLGASVTADQWAAISAGTFDDLFIGDYWTINSVNYRIASFDYWLHNSDPECTTHHVVLVPDTILYSAKMNDTNITTGGYTGSKMYTNNLASAKTTINTAFGSAHILSHKELLVNAAASGYASGGAWFASTVELMSESMVYGHHAWAANTSASGLGYETGIDKGQLPLFALEPSRICNRANWWLRDVVSSTNFALVSRVGYANHTDADGSYGVRPCFAIMA